MQSAKIDNSQDVSLTRLLLVEIKGEFQDNLITQLHSVDKSIKIKTAEDLVTVGELLKVNEFDYLVFGPSLFEEDAIEILSLIVEDFNGVPMILVGNSRDTEDYKYSRMNVVKCIEESVDTKVIAENIKETIHNSSRSFITGFSLDSLVQTVDIERKTCTLFVFHHHQMGLLFFEKGELYDAETSNLYGQDAINEMFSWHNIKVEIRPGNPRKTKEIKGSLVSILMTAFTNKDENGSGITKKENITNSEEKMVKQEKVTSSGDHLAFLKSLEKPAPKPKAKEKTTETVDHIEFLKSLGIDKDYREELLEIPVPKEENMQISRVNELIEKLKDDLGTGLIGTDIFVAADGQSIAGFNSNVKASALFNQMTDYLNKALSGSGFPSLGKYYFIDLQDHHMVIVVPLGRFRQGLFIDTSKVQLGLLLNVVLPEYIQNINEALA